MNMVCKAIICISVHVISKIKIKYIHFHTNALGNLNLYTDFSVTTCFVYGLRCPNVLLLAHLLDQMVRSFESG